jgi:hypothetical protein
MARSKEEREALRRELLAYWAGMPEGFMRLHGPQLEYMRGLIAGLVNEDVYLFNDAE